MTGIRKLISKINTICSINNIFATALVGVWGLGLYEVIQSNKKKQIAYNASTNMSWKEYINKKNQKTLVVLNYDNS